MAKDMSESDASSGSAWIDDTGESGLRRGIVANMRDVLWIATPDPWRIVSVSPSYEVMWGRSCRELLERPAVWRDAIHPTDRDPVIRDALPRMTAGRHEHTYRIVRPDGTVRWIRERGFPIRDGRGVAYRVAGMAEDVTARRRAEEAMRASELKYRSLVENIPDVIWTASRDGASHFVTSNVERLYGFSAEEMCREGASLWLGRIHRDDVEAVSHAYDRVFAAGELFDLEYRIQAKDGRWLWVHDRAVATYDKDGTQYCDGICSDVTKRKQLEEQILRAQKMDAVGVLASGVAHEFNNLLSVILSLASSLHDELPNEERRSCAAEIERAAKRAAVLTRQLLAFGRKQVIRPEALQIREVVGGMAKMLRCLVGEHTKLDVRVAGSAGHVHMDPSQLEQVLVNLVANAREAMPAGGRLTIEATDVDLHEARGGTPRAMGHCVRIRVSDTGPGMDAATQGRIFEPFFTTKEKGTGLGLATVYGVIQQSGGAVDVESTVGAGTTFTIHLPRVDPPPPRVAETPPVPLHRTRGECLLVVEDEPQLRSALHRSLSAAGYRVLLADNGEHGLATFHEHGSAIDAVLTDIVMPGMGGIALGRSIRELSSVPVLYMSGHSEEVASGKAQIPPELFLQKPFDREALLERIREVFGTGPDGRARPPSSPGRR
jgi:two-component system cell cycle sensor histidine kinase/response regulator CckA